ncbi:unnamed protein product [Diatraea saccharalis]|uniref:Tyrosine specific protein phosphatases domain-containing protein n=1 Tax=Diatraea saccharalis TaxID=40085 RepID=A0A9N9RAM1_9NEOP|nr:unnamed protein product [Diatraea saccharalis]
MLDMAKVLSFALQEGRVAVHCHAGLGRTGVLIACYLVYSLRVRANDAIRLVRKKRPSSVQTSGQILCVQQFEHYLLPQTVVFSSKEPIHLTKNKRTSEFTLKQYLYRQRATLHGLDERAFKLLPMVVYNICERLLRLCGSHQSVGLDFRVRNKPFYKSFLAYRLKQGRPPDPDTPEDGPMEQACMLPMIEWRDPVEEDIERNLESVSRITGTANNGNISALKVYEGFVIDHSSLPEERQKYLKELRNDINQRREAISKINDEEDPAMLSGLLFAWLEGLKQPILDREDLSIIVGRTHNVEACILALQMEDIMLVEYLLRFVTRLRPLAAAKKVDIIKRLLSSLTHQCVMISGQCLPTHKDFPRLRDGTCTQVTNFMLRMIVEIQRDMLQNGKDDADVHEFYLGISVGRVTDVYGGCIAKENTVRFWFQRFLSGNFDLQNKSRGRPETQINNEELKAIVEADPSQTTSELAAGCGVSDKTVLIHLSQIGKIKKLERLLGYLTNRVKQTG